ncbi:MAG: PHP domain-containing protein, partial [Oscillospiraceae bacterium]
SKAVYKQHIMHALMDFGYTNEIFSPLYKALFDEEKGSCNVNVQYPDVNDVLSFIKLAGGIAILAHPRVFDNFALFEEMAKNGQIHGAEAFSPKNTKEDTKLILEICRKYDLIPTGGSDFHGLYNSAQAPLGSYTTSQESLDLLFKLKEKV